MAEKLNMGTRNLSQEHIRQIQQLFPNAVTEIKKDGSTTFGIDFDVLKQELSNELIDEKQERYQMTWPDKKKSMLLANSKVNGTLRPIKEKSVDFDNTKNIYIEGDNLDVLKLLRETYLNKVKMIYIDPPYNTGKSDNFIYKDDFSQSSDEYNTNNGQYDELGNRLFINNDTNGRFHTDWLNMMYPRLKVARDLLTDDGVIFISINSIEVFNLKKICDEVFGANNFISIMPRKTVEFVRVRADYELQNINDYLIVYSKNINMVKLNKKIVGKIEYKYEDENGKYTLKEFQNSGENGTRTARPNLYYPIYFNVETKRLSLKKEDENVLEILPKKVMNEDGRWLWSKEKFLDDNYLLEYKNGTIYRKIYYNENDDQNIYQSEKTWLDMYPNRLGAKALSDLKLNGLFDYSKPVELLDFLLNLNTKDNDLILDFFSGSATTAHSIFKLNAVDRKNRKFIMVQLPELCNEKSKAYKAGYKTICDIGEERIRRAGKKIKDELIEKNNNAGMLDDVIDPDSLDIGFRVFKLDSSNMNDVYYNPNQTQKSILDATIDNIKPCRTGLDLLFQVMLELGVELSAKIEEKDILGKKCYFVNDNKIVACFNDNLTNELLTKIANTKPTYAVFKDSCFSNDSVAINNEQIFKTYSPSTKVKVL